MTEKKADEPHTGARTQDVLQTGQLLYQLSYMGCQTFSAKESLYIRVFIFFYLSYFYKQICYFKHSTYGALVAGKGRWGQAVSERG